MFVTAVTFLAVASATLAGDGAYLPDDPHFGLQWGLCNTGQDIRGVPGKVGADVHAPDAWGLHRGTSSVVVGVVSTGIDPHPEFAERLLQGWSVVGDPYYTFDVGHLAPVGTHVAGIIGAAAGNGEGIAGLAGQVWLLPVRVMESSAVSANSVAEGIVWAVDNGADIVVVPVEFYAASAALEAAVLYAVTEDVLVIAPVGGGGGPTVAYPAAYPGCLAVAATTNLDEMASFSNHGLSVDLAAPGKDIFSTGRGDGYVQIETAWRSATGFVAGIAALVLSFNPQLTAAELAQILLDSADDLGPPGWDEYSGAGRVNAFEALQLAQPPALRFEEVEPLPERLVPGVPTSFVVRIARVAETPVPGSARLFYRTSPGSFLFSPIATLGDDLFKVELPGVPCDTVIEFFFAAAGNRGTVVYDPLGGGDGPYSAYAMADEPRFDDDFEVVPAVWDVEGGDSTSGGWARVVPVGTEYPPGVIAQPGFDRTPGNGKFCYITGQHYGDGAGTNDVDGGPVRLLSPVIAIDAPDVEVSYARWFYTTVGSEPDELVVEFSRDGGGSWTTVETVTATDGWEYHRFRLSEFPDVAGNELRVRFSVADPPDDRSLTEAGIDEFQVRAILCAAPTGDFDSDGFVTLNDYGHLQDCLDGPGATYFEDGCRVFDFDYDHDVDLTDCRAFQESFGPVA
ncbi:MAG: S8 family serine peptidase, partial [Planctomycetes bacterium]|nr:S8 family serine peptidase [Planctomycetota bacterium]